MRAYEHHSPGQVQWLVLDRDQHRCTACGWDAGTAAQMLSTDERLNGRLLGSFRVPAHRRHTAWLDVDHIVPAAMGGPLHPDNLRSLCLPCHRRRHR